MGTQDIAASIQGVGIRVTRLDANGLLLNNAGDSYATTAFIQVTFTPEYESGDEITQKAASGAVCVTYQAPDTLKRITMEVAICNPDPEITSLISGGILLRKNVGTDVAPDNKSIGWAAPAVGDDPAGNGVAIEAWSLAIKEGKKATKLPYYHWIFPYAKLRQSGDRVIENGLLATTFEGFGLGNIEFGQGADGRWEFPVTAGRPYSYARSDWAPVGMNGFYIWHPELTNSVSNGALTSNVATITTSVPHQFSVGDKVVLADLTATLAPMNGSHTILSTPTSTTFTFAQTTTDIVSATSAVGTATVGAGGTAVTDLPEGVDSTDFNVPGNVDYTEGDIDFVVDSIKNPA